MKGSVFVGTSLDGFIARPDDAIDFLETGGDVPHGFEEFLDSVDAIVMGRRTYDVVLGLGGWYYGEKPVFVLSSREIGAPPDGAVVERRSGSPGDIFSDLAARGMEHVYVDGGFTIQQFLRAGLIHRLIITRLPVLIGSGISLFGQLEHDIALKHVSTRSFDNGLVQSEYQVAV